jgi:hypothetical protein
VVQRNKQKARGRLLGATGFQDFLQYWTYAGDLPDMSNFTSGPWKMIEQPQIASLE